MAAELWARLSKGDLFADIPFATPPQVDTATPAQPAAGPWTRFVSNVPPQVDTATPSLADMLVQELGAGPAPAALQEPVVAPEPAPLGTAAPSEVVAPVGALPAAPQPTAPVDQPSLSDMLTDPMLQAIALSKPAPGADMTPADPNAYPGDGADLLTQRGRQAGQGLAQAIAGIPEFASIFNAGRAANRAENEQGAAQEYQAQIDELGTLIPQSDPARAVQLAGEVQRLTMLRDAALKQGATSSTEAAPAISDRAGYQLGETIKRKAAETFGAPDPNDRSFWGGVAQGIGQVGGMAAIAVPTLGTGGFASGMGMQGAQGYDEARAAGASEDVAKQAADLNLLVGATDMLPLMRAFKLLPESVRGAVTNRFLRGALKLAEGSGEEAVQEYGQQVAQNLIAQKLYDPDRGWNDQAAESALIGAVVGAVPASVGAAREVMGKAPGSPNEAATSPSEAPTSPSGAQPAIADMLAARLAEQQQAAPAAPAPARPETSQLPVDAPALATKPFVASEPASQAQQPAEAQAPVVPPQEPAKGATAAPAVAPNPAEPTAPVSGAPAEPTSTTPHALAPLEHGPEAPAIPSQAGPVEPAAAPRITAAAPQTQCPAAPWCS